jgi:hypothetical protein
VRTSNGSRTHAGGEASYRGGDGYIGSNNVTSSSDSTTSCVVDSSSTTVSDKVKLTVNFLWIEFEKDDGLQFTVSVICTVDSFNRFFCGVVPT